MVRFACVSARVRADDLDRERVPVIRRGLGAPTRSAAKAPQQAEATLGTWTPSRCSVVDLGVLLQFLGCSAQRHGGGGHEGAEEADNVLGSFL